MINGHIFTPFSKGTDPACSGKHLIGFLGQGRGVVLIDFADFCDVITLTMPDFKLPM